MCYLENKEFKIIPKNSYEVTRNCAKCGCKTNYINTNNFRVNANGNTIDVWLIYQCKKCKHTFNLSIYKRVNPFEIDKLEYEKFLSNDKELAFKCGINKELFEKNKADISESNIEYDIIQSKNEVKNALFPFISKSNLYVDSLLYPVSYTHLKACNIQYSLSKKIYKFLYVKKI